MRLLLLLFIVFSTTSLFTQKVNIPIPDQNADSLSTQSIMISIDTLTKDIEIITSHFNKLNVFHKHRRYQTSLIVVDTVALITNEVDQQYEIRILLCQGRELKMDDPYKGKVSTGFFNKNRLRLGYWNAGEIEKELTEAIHQINLYIPKKETCNSRRDMKPYRGHSYMTKMDGDFIYSSGVVMPSLNGSNSVQSRHEQIQKVVDDCLKDSGEESVFKLTYTIDETGKVVEISSFDCPSAIKDQVLDCLYKTKWTPGKLDNKEVKVKCTTLIGLNVDDKFQHFENQLKQPENKPVPAKIPAARLDDMFDNFDSEDAQVYKVVEQMPHLVDDSYFDKLRSNVKKAFPDKEVNQTLQFTVEKDGSVSDVRLLRSTNKEIGKWLTKEIVANARFIPGKQRGQVVRVEMTQQIKL